MCTCCRNHLCTRGRCALTTWCVRGISAGTARSQSPSRRPRLPNSRWHKRSTEATTNLGGNHKKGTVKQRAEHFTSKPPRGETTTYRPAAGPHACVRTRSSGRSHSTACLVSVVTHSTALPQARTRGQSKAGIDDTVSRPASLSSVSSSRKATQTRSLLVLLRVLNCSTAGRVNTMPRKWCQPTAHAV